MKRSDFIALLVAALLLALADASRAQAVVLPLLPDAYVPVAPGDDALYRQLGGEAGIARVTSGFLERVLVDRRTEPFFRDADHALLKAQLAVQICEVAGGPCRRAKRNIRRAHSGMDIRAGDFNAVVELLQSAMDAEGIAFRAQNHLLAQLAPMHRDIVNVR